MSAAAGIYPTVDVIDSRASVAAWLTTPRLVSVVCSEVFEYNTDAKTIRKTYGRGLGHFRE